MPSRVDVKQDEIMVIILNHLREALDLTEARCYETVRPDLLPPIPSGSDYVLTVSMGEGTFEIPEQFDGQCCEEIDVTIMAIIRINLDPANPATALLHDATRGLLKLKHLLLRAMVGQDLRRVNGEYFLRDLVYAKRSIAPDVADAAKIGTVGTVGIVFGIKSDWDLTASD